MPQNLTAIEAAFYRCYSLATIVIPKNVTDIGYEAFFRCSSLTAIIVDPDNDNYCDIDGVLFNKAKTELIAYPEGNSADDYTIPDTVTKIGDSALGYHCRYLKALTIPSSVTEFPEYNMFVYPNDITPIVKQGSAAERYAEKFGLEYKTY